MASSRQNGEVDARRQYTGEVEFAEARGGGTFPVCPLISQAVSLDELINNEKEA
jgi:hypothetical protein